VSGTPKVGLIRRLTLPADSNDFLCVAGYPNNVYLTFLNGKEPRIFPAHLHKHLSGCASASGADAGLVSVGHGDRSPVLTTCVKN
jgi:hypothetical protein